MALITNPVHSMRRHVCGSEEEHHHSLLGEHAAALWKHNKITDVVIKLHNKVFKAHRAVLSCYSEYFREILLKTLLPDGVIELKEPSITPEAFQVLLLYMYTGELKVSCQNIGDVYSAAKKLLMGDVVEQCAKILCGKTKKIVNYVYLYVTAKKLEMWDASRTAMRKMQRHFEQIAGTTEFLDLTHDQLCELLSADELAVRSEVVVYLAALKWISDKYLYREKYAVEILRCVRFSLMTLNEILACYTPPLLPAITEVREIQQMLLEATCYVAAKTVNDENRFERFTCNPRIYLLEREPIVLWDPNIFDPDRYRQYKEEVAATKIQANFRGYITRKKLKKELELENAAATKIQAHFPGFETRKRFNSLRSSFVLEHSPVSPSQSPSPDISPQNMSKPTCDAQEPNKKQVTDQEIVRKVTPAPPHSTADYSVQPEKHEDLAKQEEVTYAKITLVRTPLVSAVDPCVQAFVQNLGSSLESLSQNILRSHRQDTALITNPASYKSKTSNPGKAPKNLREIDRSEFRSLPDLSEESFETAEETDHSSSSVSPPKDVIHKIYTDPEVTESGPPDGDLNLAAAGTASGFDDNQRFIEKWRTKSDIIIAMGGFDPNNLENDRAGRFIHAYVPMLGEWRRVGEMERALHHLCVLYYIDCIYCIGGCDPQVTKSGKMIPVNLCSKYNLATNTWYRVCSMNHSRMYHAAVLVNGKIYAIGGKDENDSILDSVEWYDPFSDSWLCLDSSLSCPKMGFGACAYKSQLWIAGGTVQDISGSLCFVQEVECYDPIQNTWLRTVAQLPIPRSFCTLVVCKQMVYVVGGTTYGNWGENESTESISNVDCYDDENDEWVPKPPLPHPRHAVSAVTVGGAILVLGGLTTYRMAALDEVLVHDENMGCWASCSPMPTYMCGFAATSMPKDDVLIKTHQIKPWVRESESSDDSNWSL